MNDELNFQIGNLDDRFIPKVKEFIKELNNFIIDNDGDKYWYKNGLLHREDGPAVEFFYGHKQYWINGIQQ